ncbi:MAG: lipid IV(A) 3-deoxy-D-manno-octulosonic acid transferase [Gammaproteobacteria bacterium]|nr:lipid IV(A) 3-deoxy-D-manno-octulosonic acid transferase [Gammaproteobacteria bacterium]
MNRTTYNILFTLVLPLIILRLLWRAVRAPAYARRWAERFGFVTLTPEQSACAGQWLWVHAVSVGESIAAAPMIRKLRAEHPELPIVVTTMTPTGSERVVDMFGDDVCHVYAPYDHPFAVQRFLKAFRPQLLVIMETELWPNIIHYSKASGARVIVANARLSEKSARGYEKFAKLGKPMLQQIDCIAVQGPNDAERFRRLGVQDQQLRITGSIKFEMDLPDSLEQKTRELRALIHGEGLQGERPVWIAASTRAAPGVGKSVDEEVKVLAAFQRCLQEIPDLLLILVPRHPERFRSVATLCTDLGLNVVKRSEQRAVTADTNVLLGDSMGEMLAYFSVSDVAFIGGSLVDTGCHNVIEPAALGLPVFVGPSQFNFQAICEQLQEAGALRTVANEDELAAAVIGTLRDEVLCRGMGEAGQQFIAANRGALQRTCNIVLENLCSFTVTDKNDRGEK